jgi:hypothetical protein
METLLVISGKELELLRSRRRRWWLGWAVAGLLLLGLVWEAGQVRAYHKSTAEVRVMKLDLEEVQRQQLEDTRALVLAWDHQQQAINMVVAAAEYLQERKNLVDYSRGMARSH